MKYCRNCGCQLSEEAKFCSNCGLLQNTNARQKAIINKAGNGLKIKILLCIPFLCLIGMIGFLLLRKDHIPLDLSKYIKVTFYGYDGYGGAYTEFLDREFEEDLYQALVDQKVIKSSDNTFHEEDLRDFPGYQNIREQILFQLECNNRLSNGEEVRISYEYDNNQLKKYRICFETSNDIYEVEGLDDIVTYDPFENVEITFSGFNGEGYAELSVPDIVSNLEFVMDRDSELSNGNLIEVSVKMPGGYSIENYALIDGRIPSRTVKQYMVEGLDDIIIQLSSINSDVTFTNKIDRHSRVCIIKSTEKWDKDEKIIIEDRVGELFLADNEDNNILFMIYLISYRNTSGTTADYYYFTAIPDIILDKNGQLKTDYNQIRSFESYDELTSEEQEIYVDDDHYVIGFGSLNSLKSYFETKFSDIRYEINF